MTDTPVDAYPYLWTSADMDVTPGSRKSNGSAKRPSCVRNGRRKPPMHASTWQRMPRSRAREAMSAMGSTTPWGEVGADPTTMMVGTARCTVGWRDGAPRLSEAREFVVPTRVEVPLEAAAAGWFAGAEQRGRTA